MRILSLLPAMLASTLLGIAATSHAEDLIAYWNLNNSLARTAGSTGSLGVTYAHLSIGDLGFGPGTTLNTYGGSPAGTGLDFHELINVAALGNVDLLHLDLRGYEAPTVSFAYQKTSLLSLYDHFALEYRIGNGNWVHVTTIPAPPENYDVFSYTFASGIVDDHANISFRIHFQDALEVNSSLLFDNLKVTATAIPEPGSMVFAGAAILMAAGAFHRRRKS